MVKVIQQEYVSSHDKNFMKEEEPEIVKKKIIRRKVKKPIVLERNSVVDEEQTPTEQPETKTYRFKFSEGMTKQLMYFSQIHKLDTLKEYKEAWEKWTIEHNEEIETEYTFLSKQGFQGDIYDKMFKSCRYYYSKKTLKELNSIYGDGEKEETGEKTMKKTRETKPRKQYVHISKTILELIDTHISKHKNEPEFKPAKAYIDFCETNYYTLENYKLSVLDNETMNEDEYNDKLKKTYKNRYYLIVKKGVQSKYIYQETKKE